MEQQAPPIAIIGAGPVGLAAAAHALQHGLTPLVLEQADQPAGHIQHWSHVRVFSPWRYNIDAAARALLHETAWDEPDPDHYPTGAELIEDYLAPLAQHPRIAANLHLNNRVVSVSRLGFDKLKSHGREQAPFVLTTESADGEARQFLASAVIDASGSWSSPNPLGANGTPAVGECDVADAITYGIPDVLGSARAHYAGRRVLVVGSGHSAFNALLDLATLQEHEPQTTIEWAIRRTQLGQLFGGGANDMLPERGALGMRVRTLVASGAVRLHSGFGATNVRRDTTGLVVSDGSRDLPAVDRIIVATGFRPNLAMLRELRVSLDSALESPISLAPLIDPNVHSCGSVPPHGVDELAHPEPGFYIAGVKSYGRAPTFLLMTGYEQVRSIVAALAGDWASARDVRLVLPETGVCSVDRSSLASSVAACCGNSPSATVAGILPANQEG